MINKRIKFGLFLATIVALLSIFIGQSLAQVAIPPSVSNNAGVLVYEDANGIVSNLVTADDIAHMAWSKDGQQIGFIRVTGGVNAVLELGIANVGQQPIETVILQTQRLTWGYGISWTQDGRLLFVADNPNVNPETGISNQLDIFATSINEKPEFLGTFTVGDGCGGGSALPADWRYNREIGGFGTFLTLAETQQGILYSVTCSGSELSLLNPETGFSTPFASNLTNAVVSPDGNSIAGVELDYSIQPLQSELAVYDIATGSYEIISTQQTPSLVFWNQDGTGLYYTTRTDDVNLVDTLSDSERAELASIIGYELDYIPTYQSTAYFVSLTTGETTAAYSVDAFAISRIFEAPDALYISRVPNLDSWLAQLMSGTIDYMDEAENLEAVQAELFQIKRSGTVFGEESFIGWYDQFTPYIQAIDAVVQAR